jgi:hypothetical protein
MENKEKVIKLIDDNVNEIEKLVQETIQIWLEHIVYSSLWWLAIGLTIVPWILWFKYRKKNSSDRILYAGFSVIIISICLDAIGDQYGYWTYRFNVIPVFPAYLPWDTTLMPVTVMYFLQFKPNLHPFIKACMFAFIASFVAEPLFHWLGIYEPTKWKYIYSFPIHIIIYLIAHRLSRRENFAPIYEN